MEALAAAVNLRGIRQERRAPDFPAIVLSALLIPKQATETVLFLTFFQRIALIKQNPQSLAFPLGFLVLRAILIQMIVCTCSLPTERANPFYSDNSELLNAPPFHKNHIFPAVFTMTAQPLRLAFSLAASLIHCRRHEFSIDFLSTPYCAKNSSNP